MKMKRLGFDPLDQILPKINPGNKIKLSVQNKKYLVNANSDRLLCFKKSHFCYLCGLEANIFSLEFHKKCKSEINPHLNLYYRFPTGKLILFTKDHLIPKSRGGNDSLDNLYTCCYPCNLRKSNSLDFYKFPQLAEFFKSPNFSQNFVT